MAQSTIRLEGVNEVLKRLDNRIKSIDGKHALSKRKNAIISSMGFQDVIDHFIKMEGPKKSWAKFRKRGKPGRQSTRPFEPSKGGNQLLRADGKMVGAIRPASNKKIAWVFVKSDIAKYHDFGTKNMVSRPFMWLSKRMTFRIVSFLEKYLMRGTGK